MLTKLKFYEKTMIITVSIQDYYIHLQIWQNNDYYS